ncbi:hypothetical protein [Isobaculum melis]|uniref:Uncharacterized protein n=1 Tax=Isobaculum melis TaxID=142588 RepID=A0A1H9PYU7_9LACT|nr:hypothetical protein [Isobaculum melis]SER53310.1 hypothetical protein SAMN04488559_101238 [Isobaculum melis]
MNRKVKWTVFFLVSFFNLSHPVLAQEEIADSYEEAFRKETIRLQETIDSPGTYFVDLTYDHQGEMIKKQVKVTVTGEQTIIEKEIAIDAQPIEVTTTEVKSFTKEDWIRLGQAKAWETKDGETLPIIDVGMQELKPEIGSYPLTFQTIHDVSITVQVNVLRDTKTDFKSNQENGWHERLPSDHPIGWEQYEVFLKWMIQIGLFASLLIPLVFLLTQYFVTEATIKKIIQAMIQNLK